MDVGILLAAAALRNDLLLEVAKAFGFPYCLGATSGFCGEGVPQGLRGSQILREGMKILLGWHYCARKAFLTGKKKKEGNYGTDSLELF